MPVSGRQKWSKTALCDAPAWGRSLLTVIIACAYVGACVGSTAVQDPPGAVILYGHVLNSSGSPVPGAQVTIQHHAGYCGSQRGEIESTVTNGVGLYRTTLTVLTSADGCVRFIANAPGYSPDSATNSNVRFLVPPALDSTETTIVLH